MHQQHLTLTWYFQITPSSPSQSPNRSRHPFPCPSLPCPEVVVDPAAGAKIAHIHKSSQSYRNLRNKPFITQNHNVINHLKHIISHPPTPLNPIQNSTSTSIRPIHIRNRPRNLRPLQLPPHLLPPSNLQRLLPLQQLVAKAQMRLDDDIEAPRAHEAVGAWVGEVEGAHDFGDADGCAAGDADAAVD